MKKAQVIVVGGGYFGTSITYHLAKHGVKTILLEQKELASGSSGANFGCIQVQDAEPGISLDLTLKSFAMWQSFKDELGLDLEYRSRGHLIAAATEQEWENLLAIQEGKKAQGLKYEVLTAEELAGREPLLNTSNLVGGTLAMEAAINPFKVIYGMAARARELGAEIYQHTTVQDIATSQNQVTEVVTDKGLFGGEVFILATGAWTKKLGAKIGLNIPVEYIKGEAFVSEVLPPLVNYYYASASFFEEAHENTGANTALCLGQTAAGNILMGETARPAAEQIDLDTKEFNSFELCAGVCTEVAKYFPELLKYKIIRSWQTFSPYTEQLRPVLNFVGYDNLLVAAGFKSAAILVPYIGAEIVNIIQQGQISADIKEFSII